MCMYVLNRNVTAQPGGDVAGVISSCIKQAPSGEARMVHGAGGQTRDYGYVDEFARVIMASAR